MQRCGGSQRKAETPVCGPRITNLRIHLCHANATRQEVFNFDSIHGVPCTVDAKAVSRLCTTSRLGTRQREHSKYFSAPQLPEADKILCRLGNVQELQTVRKRAPGAVVVSGSAKQASSGRTCCFCAGTPTRPTAAYRLEQDAFWPVDLSLIHI